MNAKDIFDADIAAIEGEMPVTFTFNGTRYVGQKTGTVDELAMQDAGYQPSFDFQLSVRRSLFVGLTAPTNNDTIEIPDDVTGDPVSYMIVSATKDPAGVEVIYSIKANN